MKTKVFICLTITLMLSPLFAGVVYEIEVKDHEQSPPKSESVQAAVEGRDLKIGNGSKGKGKQREMIFRGDRREMVMVDHETRSYHVMDEKTMGQVAGQLSDANRMMQEALKNVPEDKRAMIKQMMKQKLPSQEAAKGSEDKLEKTSERGTHNGYPCVKYEVLRDGRKTRELWVTDWDNVEGGSEVVEDMADFFREMNSFSGAAGVGLGRGGGPGEGVNVEGGSEVVGAFEDMADFFREMMDSFSGAAGVGLGRGGGPGEGVFEHMKESGVFR